MYERECCEDFANIRLIMLIVPDGQLTTHFLLLIVLGEEYMCMKVNVVRTLLA